MWDKKRYLRWKETRGEDAGNWKPADCRAADALIKDRALKTLAVKLKGFNTSQYVKEYIHMMTRCHYGSVETDDFLTKMGCYPDWL